MDLLIDYLKSFKLNRCCCLFSVRTGLLLIGYFNIIYDSMAIAAISEFLYSPIVQEVLDAITKEQMPFQNSIPIFCYITEFGFNVVLLCAVYRRDLYLLKIYLYGCFTILVTSILFYSVVIAGFDVLMEFVIVFSIILDVYVILLVRSEILEIKESQKNGGISTLVMSSGMPDAQEPHDIEAQVDCKDKPSSEGRREQKSDNKK
uniref:Uncharacterized protein n=1 Tax=Bombyx mori TaxID=7091 RepID=A0A8R2C6R8_BOMMO|nr:uncharacterized protein LOC105841963 isoform X1 [Bombyx mori]